MPCGLSRLALCLPAFLIAGAPATAAPGDAIGSAVTVVNLVTAKLEQDQRELAKGDDVRQQELIEVANDGRSELVLRDKTKLALGPGSRLLLDQFVYDPDISGGAIVLDLTRGAFRFITGIAAKPAYVIRTPTASITVRGTIFDVYVQASGMTWLLLIEGAIEVCTEDGKCLVHDEPGKLIRVTPDKVGKPVKWASLTDKDDVPFDSAFPFVVDRARHRPRPDLHPRSRSCSAPSPTGRIRPTTTKPNPTTTTTARRPTRTSRKRKAKPRTSASARRRNANAGSGPTPLARHRADPTFRSASASASAALRTRTTAAVAATAAVASTRLTARPREAAQLLLEERRQLGPVRASGSFEPGAAAAAVTSRARTAALSSRVAPFEPAETRRGRDRLVPEQGKDALGALLAAHHRGVDLEERQLGRGAWPCAHRR